MKKQILALSLGLITVGSFAQKKELRAAEKALKKNDFAGALASIKSVEGLIENADARYKSQYYFLKGQVFAGKKDYKAAADAFTALMAFEKETGKNRYASKAAPILNQLTQDASNKALNLYNKKDYKAAAEKFYLVAKLSPKDTVFMYNAAVSATQGKDYNTALKYYKELQKLGFTDLKKQYVAVDKQTGEEKVFKSKQERDLMVKSKAYIKPETKTTKSKKADIVKNMALIYKELGKTDAAINAFKEARAASPDDLGLLLAEAYMYNDLKQPAKFEALMKEAVSKDPNNPDLFFNIGVVNFNENKGEEAIKYFKKVIELKSDYKNAHYMLANSMLLKDKEYVERLNALPPSDMTTYSKIEKERKLLFGEILPVILKADEFNRTTDTVRLIMGLYQQLENDTKASEYKAIYDSMK